MKIISQADQIKARLVNSTNLDIGLWIAKTTVTKLLILFILGIACFAILYLGLSQLTTNHGIISTVVNSETDPELITLQDSFYFSIVTITSLGYGDFRPVGYSRLLVALEVIMGLMFIAILVAKITSDRTATMVRLIYTGEVNRVLNEFNRETHSRMDALHAANKQYDDDQRLYVAKGLTAHLVALLNYLIYHMDIGELEEEWAVKKSTILARTINDLLTVMISASDSAETRQKTVKQLGLAITTGEKIINRIADTYKEKATLGIQHNYNQLTTDLKTRQENTQRNPVVISQWMKNAVSSQLLNSNGERRSHQKIANETGFSVKIIERVVASIDKEDIEVTE